jgi:hypothetical protein
MAEGEVTSRQHGGVHTWDVDAAAVGDGMTRSVVRRSYLRLRARPRPAYVPVATMRNSALARPAGLGPGQRAAQFRPRRGRRRRSFSPSRDGKCAVSPSRGAVSAEARSVATQFWPCFFARHETVNAQFYRHETQFRLRRGWRPTCCAVSFHHHEAS